MHGMSLRRTNSLVSNINIDMLIQRVGDIDIFNKIVKTNPEPDLHVINIHKNTKLSFSNVRSKFITHKLLLKSPWVEIFFLH